MTGRAGTNRSLRTLSILFFGLVVLYLVFYPRLRQMREEADRINREIDHGPVAPAAGPNEIEQLRSRVTSEPANAELRTALAGKLRDAGRLTEAEEAAQAAVRLQPREPAPLLLLGDIEHRAKRYDLAIAAYRTALERFPNNAEAATALGWIYIFLGWTTEATGLLERTSKSHPDDAPLKVALALTYLQSSNLGRAERTLLEVRKARQNEVAMWSPLVDVYLKAKRPQDALKTADEALALAPNDVKLLNGRGQAQYDSGDITGAVATYQKVVQLAGDDVLAHHRLALCYKSQGKPQEAIREMELVYRKAPDFEQTRQILGQLYIQNSRAEEGRKLIEAAGQSSPVRDMQAKAGYLLLHKPMSPEAHYKMALSYQALQDRPRMIVELTRTVELAPHYADAQKLLTDALQQRIREGAP